MRTAATLVLLCAALEGSEVAITIDDLPRGGDIRASYENTRRMTQKLLRPFRTGQIPVTAFVNECKDDTLRLLPLWIRAGAVLGNHTCSHLDFHRASVKEFTADIVRGEPVTTRLTGTHPRYFRHPFLHAGNTAEKKAALEAFLSERGYRVAPVTLDNSDYMFAAVYAKALKEHNRQLALRIQREYIPYLNAICEFFERRGAQVTGHEIRQVLLIHANQLNADMMPQLLAMLRGRGYRVVTLERALGDPAYSLPEKYVGPGGFSWIHRWSQTKGMPNQGEPDEPAWIREAFEQTRL